MTAFQEIEWNRPDIQGIIRGRGILGCQEPCTSVKQLEYAWAENEIWCQELLSIVSEQSLTQLAFGFRFFTIVVVVDKKSPLIGQVIEDHTIPFPFSYPQRFVGL